MQWDSTQELELTSERGGTTYGEGTPANVTGEGVPAVSSPQREEAHSDDSNSGLQDLDDLPGPSGNIGQLVTQALSHTTTEPPPLGSNTTAPTQRTLISVPRTRQSAVCLLLLGPQATPHPQDNQGHGVSGSGHTVQGTEAQANRETGRSAVRQGEDRPRELTLLGAYQHSQDAMGQILDNVQENRWLQERQYQGIREDLQAINNTLISIAVVLADMANSGLLPLARHLNSLPLPLPLVARRPRHRTHRPPEHLPLQKVSAHQKKGLWRAITKVVRTLGVYARRITHCRKRLEDLRCWAWKTAEAQLGWPPNEEGVPVKP
ncbi:hypothetical protein NDU88_005365 [Pleurodeles waltl]|uniref:Uncharacterized protein n=1 Tax=Pleurodeles waltl TaxID=8319 RepID=A0AAV7VN13_PLEWA|nr:hypothetical protein NDU88_005365 [Pleurodeles waltl]